MIPQSTPHTQAQSLFDVLTIQYPKIVSQSTGALTSANVNAIKSHATLHSAGKKHHLAHPNSSSHPYLSASPQADKRRHADPQYAAEYMKDIMSSLRHAEEQLSRDPYLSHQPELSEKMRTILVDWLVEVHLKFKCRPETLFLAVDIVDRYLSVARTTRSTLQLVGVTAILLAAKYEEIWPPEIKDCVYISANTYSREDILTMERLICGALHFRLTTPNVMHFTCRLLDVMDADTSLTHATFYYSEISLLSYAMYGYLPSLVAAACVYLACRTRGHTEPWTPLMQHYSGYTLPDVFSVAQQLLEYAHVLLSSKYTAVKRKYDTDKYANAASCSLPQREDF